MKPGSPGELDGEFRYLKLGQEIQMQKGIRYLVTMTTKAGDGDHFHDPVAYDGLSPVINPGVRIIRNLLFRNENIGQALAIPSFADLHSEFSAFRIPVGPTIRFKTSPLE